MSELHEAIKKILLATATCDDNFDPMYPSFWYDETAKKIEETARDLLLGEKTIRCFNCHKEETYFNISNNRIPGGWKSQDLGEEMEGIGIDRFIYTCKDCIEPTKGEKP